jgi:anti-sigma factor RsiW
MPERIGAGEDLQTNPHLLTCDRCRALVRDLEAIAEAARRLMPATAEPPDKLWEQIERAIAEEEG